MMNGIRRLGLAVALALAIPSLLPLPLVADDFEQSAPTEEVWRARPAIVPSLVTLSYSTDPPRPDDVQPFRNDGPVGRRFTTAPVLGQAEPVAVPRVAPTPLPSSIVSANSPIAAQSRAAGDFVLFVNATVPISGSSLVNEPSFANKGRLVFYTGNHYAARSVDGGGTWSRFNPYEDMDDFCCDQDVIYNPSRELFLWYRQGLEDANGENRVRLGVSEDALAWFFYDVHPYDLDPAWTGQWFDYPSLAYGDNFLYIATNVFAGDAFASSVFIRWPLDALKNGEAATYEYYSSSDVFTFTPVQGARGRVYWASHLNTATLRLYAADEGSVSVSIWDIPIPPFSPTPTGSANCPAPDGGDICTRADDRILGGWVANGILGFLWNVRQDVSAGFPYPYIYVVRIAEDTKAFVDAPVIWNSEFGWIYGWAAPNARGHLGLVAFAAGAALYPVFAVAIFDDFSAFPPPWDFRTIAASTDGPSLSCLADSSFPCWGDYARVRAYGGTGTTWAASGFSLQGSAFSPEPIYVVFGRARDDPFDFSLATAGNIEVPQGGSGSTTVIATLTDGEPRTVTLRCAAGLPPGASCSFSPESGPPSFSATLTIAATVTTPAGTFQVSIVGEAAGKANGTQLALVVTVPPPLLLSISAEPLLGDAPLRVSFTSSVTGGVGPYSNDWTFGDGGTSVVPNPEHTYDVAGTYNVTLTVTDASGRQATETVRLVVRPRPTPAVLGPLVWLLFVVVAVVGALFVAFALVRRRRAPAGPPPAFVAPSVPPPPPWAGAPTGLAGPVGPPGPQAGPPPPPVAEIECPSCRLTVPARPGPCPVCDAELPLPPEDERIRALEQAYRAGRVSESLYRANLERLRKK